MLALVSQKHNVFFLDFGMYSKSKKNRHSFAKICGCGCIWQLQRSVLFSANYGSEIPARFPSQTCKNNIFFFFSKFYLHPERLPFSSSLSLPFFLCNLRRVSSSSTTPPSVGLQLLKQRHLIIAEATQAYVPLCVCVCVYVYVCTSYAFFVCIFCVYTAFPRMSFPLFGFNLLLIVIS